MADEAGDALSRWSQRHDGVDPASSAWIRGWARLTDTCARPLERAGVSPDTVTVAGVVVSAGVPLVAAAGAAWPLLATLVLVVAAVLDGVDGALAGRTGRSTRWGQVLDPLADRCSDLLLLLTLVVLGAPTWVGVLAGTLTLLLESARSSAQVAGMSGPGAVTVWERPSRVIVAAFGTALCAGAWALGLSVDAVATSAAGLAVLLAVVGLGQLLRAVRRELSGS